MKHILFFLCMSSFLAGCSDCFSTRYSTTQLLNETATNQNIEFCRQDKPSEKKSLTLAASEQKLFQWDSKKIFNRSDLNSQCHDKHDEQENVSILLSSSTLQNFRLCMDEAALYSVIARSHTCALNTTEITSACQ